MASPDRTFLTLSCANPIVVLRDYVEYRYFHKVLYATNSCKHQTLGESLYYWINGTEGFPCTGAFARLQ